MLSKLASISRWAKISLLTGFVFAASVGACDITHWKSTVDSTTGLVTWENVPCKFIKPGTTPDTATIRDLLDIDTTWGELDSVRANMCMDYTGLYNHVLVARRGFTCGLGTADQQWDHTCGCDCRWYDIWRKIERIDTAKRLQGKYSFSYVDNSQTARDQDNCSLLHFVTQYHGGIAFMVHIAKHYPTPAREYMTVDTVECCPGLGTHLVRFRNLPGWECWCIPENPLIIAQPCTIRFDTTWHSKVQFTVDTVGWGIDIIDPIPCDRNSVRFRSVPILDTTWLPIPVDIWIKDSTVDILE